MQRIIVFIILIGITPIVHAQWLMQGLGYELPDISTKRVDVVDQNVVWTSNMDYGVNPPLKYFSRTQNGGTTWNPGQITTFQNYCIFDLCAVNYQTAWLLLMNNATYKNWVILSTTDGGLNWQQQFTPLPDSINYGCIHFWNTTEGLYFASKPKERFYAAVTVNGGNTWTEVDSVYIPQPINYGLINSETCCAYSVAGDNIWIATKRGRVLRSTDKGHHWAAYNTTFTSPVGLYGVSFNDLNHGLFFKPNSLANPPIAESLDGGLTWLNFTPTGPYFWEGICWVPQSNNVCVSVGSYFFGFQTCSYSFDAGHTWTAWDTLIDTQLFRTDWANASCGWAGSITTLPNPSNTGIYKFTGTLVDILSINPKVGGIKVYPNPCAGQINLVNAGFEEKEIRIAVYNMEGRQVYNKYYNKGLIHTQEQINLSSLPNGPYLLTFTSCEKIYKQNFIIQR